MTRFDAVYRDRWIECTADALIIRGYYFPFGTKKTIPYERIREVRAVPMGPFTGQGRIWGSGDFKHWAHIDTKRPRKRTALLLDVGSFFVPVITPDDPARVKEIIEARVAAATGPGRGGSPDRE
jgi:hypothetical protein